MLKGINKRVVEVVDIENEYFEKAILFLRAGRPDSDEGLLRQRAGEYVRAIKYRPRRAKKRPLPPFIAREFMVYYGRVHKVCLLAISAGGGVC